MHKFTVIAGSGHCGSMWLATVMDQQERVNAYHELRQSTADMAWFNAAQVPVAADVYRPYWQKLGHELRNHEVVVSNGWAAWELPEVHRQVLVHQVIYLVRHGVPQLHSLSTKSNVWRSHELDSYAFDGWLRRFWEIDGRPFKPWEEWSRWERLCMLIRANDAAPAWLAARGFYVTAYRLEDLTTDPAVLGQIVRLPAVELERWQKKDINRKVKGNRHPAWLWKKWNRDQRAAFNRICGPVQQRYGYELLEV